MIYIKTVIRERFRFNNSLTEWGISQELVVGGWWLVVGGWW
ncbi:MAG: hypothetical protein ACHBN1_21285 [Heteroscytonema crispum UTEX LB 1556]